MLKYFDADTYFNRMNVVNVNPTKRNFPNSDVFHSHHDVGMVWVARFSWLMTTVAMAFLMPTRVMAVEMTDSKLGENLNAYNVAWDSPSENSAGSMPLGNGDVGINTWVDKSGDLVLYISKTDAWDENARLCKVGRVRVKFEPALQVDKAFRQELKLHNGVIQIDSQIQDQPVKILIWVDSNQPMVRVDAESAVAVSCRAEVELWRLRERPFGNDDSHSGNGINQLPSKPVVLPDVVVESKVPGVVWYHRNTRSIYPESLEIQNLSALKGEFADPLLNRTFGASLRGSKLVQDGPKAVKSAKPAKRHQLTVCTLSAQTETADAWVQKLDELDRSGWKTSFEQSLKTTTAWWRKYWNGSWVFVEEGGGSPASELSPITRGYLLQRFISACAGRGEFPIKFNGTIFNVEAKPGANPETPDGDPDWRRWGGNYWFQNTRLVYWPMLASGNYEMMKPMFRMYQAAIPLSTARAKAYYNLDNAAVFPETMFFWGLPNFGDWGMTNKGPEMSSNYIRRHFNNGIELTALMLEYYHHTKDDEFVRKTLVPVAAPLISFFELYWPKRDADGKIIFEPSQALETYQNATNPLPDIAGLHYVLPRLLALPEKTIRKEQRDQWERMLKSLPPVPVAQVDGKTVLRPAAVFGNGANFENPELYAVFPYKLYGVGSPELQVGLDSFGRRTHRQNKGWCKDSMQAAALGLGDEAGKMLADRTRQINKGSRFPAFWGPNHDWVPDQDHGGNILSTLQLMLLQYDTASAPKPSSKTAGKIFLLPAFPKTWNASFKLHAPHNTTVEAEVRDGKVTYLKVTPESRKADVIDMFAK